MKQRKEERGKEARQSGASRSKRRVLG